MNEKAIDDALELCITSCLQNLQKSKPSLLLNGSQLKKTEREVKFIPSVAAALASLVLNCEDAHQRRDMMNVMSDWQTSHVNHDNLTAVAPNGIKQKTLSLTEDSLSIDLLESKTLQNKHREVISSNKIIHSQLAESISPKFHEVLNLVEERKEEQTKRSWTEYLLRKKKARCDSESDNSNCTSVEDLDNFFPEEKSILSNLSDDLHVDAEMSSNEEKKFWF